MLRNAARIFTILLFSAVGALPASAQFQTQFGSALAVDGGMVLVGDASSDARPGAVHIYTRAGGDWTEQARLHAPGSQPGDGFGSALALAGRNLLIGAPVQEDRRGVVHAFTRGAGGAWQPAARLVAADITPGDGFGMAVAVDGDHAFVGAPFQAERAGAVYVFRRGANGEWTQVAKFSGSGENSFFGARLAVRGDRALVSAFNEGNATGAVYPYRLVNGSWQAGEKLVAEPAQPQTGFGFAIHMAERSALISAPRANGGVGAIYRFDATADGWVPAGRIAAPDTTAQEMFGAGIARAGAELWVGAPLADQRRGAIYALRESNGGWSVARRVSSPVPQRAQFGGAIVTGQGIAVVGMPGADYGLGRAAILEVQGNEVRVAKQLEGETETLAALTGSERRCNDADSIAVFGCREVDLMAFLPIKDIGGARGVRLNDVWGWTDPQTKREYAIVGRMDGTSFIDITDAAHPAYLGDLPLTEGANPNAWRDMKVYRDHVFVVADAAGKHGMQVFDLTLLRAVQPGSPRQFEAAVTYDRIDSAHNIVINEESGFAYIVGASGGESCGGGLHMVDIRDPKAPSFAGCFADPQTGRAATGYTHDAQCVMYRGPDADYQGREICLGANETALSIADVTDKAAPKAVARASYPNVGYSHQGWLTDDHRYFFMDDELDELNGSVPKTRTLIWDLTDLDDPQLAGEFMGETSASDHNLYIRGDTMYQSNYQAGLRVIDISNVTRPVEIGYFDTVPYGPNTPGFGGSWSNFPYFRSGTIVVTSGSEGVFLLKKRPARPVS